MSRPCVEISCTIIDECGGLVKLERLQNHIEENICQTVSHIIDKYFLKIFLIQYHSKHIHIVFV